MKIKKYRIHCILLLNFYIFENARYKNKYEAVQPGSDKAEISCTSHYKMPVFASLSI
jgi:hypothetical protein